MIQQSPQASLSSSHFNQYLAMSSFALTESGVNQSASIVCTPENYMLVLGYCTSLEKEIEMLKNELRCAREEVREVRNKNEVLQSSVRLGKGMRCKEGNLKQVAATSFGMVRSYQTQRNSAPVMDEKEKCGDCCGYNDEIVEILKQENQALSKKIKKLYQQNEKLIESYQKWLREPLGARKEVWSTRLENKQGSQVANIQRSLQNSNQELAHSNQEMAYNNQSNTVLDSYLAKPMQRVILSQPNSFDISFQAFPSFKSMDDLAKSHRPHNAIYF